MYNMIQKEIINNKENIWNIIKSNQLKAWKDHHEDDIEEDVSIKFSVVQKKLLSPEDFKEYKRVFKELRNIDEENRKIIKKQETEDCLTSETNQYKNLHKEKDSNEEEFDSSQIDISDKQIRYIRYLAYQEKRWDIINNKNLNMLNMKQAQELIEELK